MEANLIDSINEIYQALPDNSPLSWNDLAETLEAIDVVLRNSGSRTIIDYLSELTQERYDRLAKQELARIKNHDTFFGKATKSG